METATHDFKSGDRVRYVPRHAHGDQAHADCEDGTVSSISCGYIRVRFDAQVERIGWHNATAQACLPGDLVIKEAEES